MMKETHKVYSNTFLKDKSKKKQCYCDDYFLGEGEISKWETVLFQLILRISQTLLKQLYVRNVNASCWAQEVTMKVKIHYCCLQGVSLYFSHPVKLLLLLFLHQIYPLPSPLPAPCTKTSKLPSAQSTLIKSSKVSSDYQLDLLKTQIRSRSLIQLSFAFVCRIKPILLAMSLICPGLTSSKQMSLSLLTHYNLCTHS